MLLFYTCHLFTSCLLPRPHTLSLSAHHECDDRPTLTTMLPFTPNPTPTTSPTVTTPSCSPPPSYSGSSTFDTNSETSPRKNVDLMQDSPYNESEYPGIIGRGSTEYLSEGGTIDGEGSVTGGVEMNGDSQRENDEERTREDKNQDELEIDGNVGSVWLWGKLRDRHSTWL